MREAENAGCGKCQRLAISRGSRFNVPNGYPLPAGLLDERTVSISAIGGLPHWLVPLGHCCDVSNAGVEVGRHLSALNGKY